ncbi:MAG: SigE family RNA polymerase sigma factor [Acidimicrobiia bacterium]
MLQRPATVRALETFESFYQRELRSVVGLAYALSGSRWAAEDIAQEAFLAAHKRWETIGRYDKPEAWLRRVVSNLSVSFFRKKAHEAKALARLAVNRDSALPPLPEEDADFWKSVRSLPKRQAQSLALHYLEDRPVAEIAEILGCAQGTVKVHLHNGRAALARRLGLSTEGVV